MVRNVNIKSYDTLIKEWREQEFDNTLDSIKKSFTPKKLSKFLYSFGENFSYVIDHHKGDIAYLSKSIESMLGYDLSNFKLYGLSFLTNKIHQDDYFKFLNISAKTQEVFNELSISEKTNLRTAYTYRVKAKNNNYVKILHQNIILEIDTKGNLVYSLVVCTNISNHTFDNDSKVEIMNFDESYHLSALISDDKIIELFSERELEVLTKLVSGKSSKEIGKSLGISSHTVNVHRKNMMRKANVNNVTSLISFSRDNGII